MTVFTMIETTASDEITKSKFEGNSVTIPGGKNNFFQLGRALSLQHHWTLRHFARKGDSLYGLVQHNKIGTAYFVRSEVQPSGGRTWEVYYTEQNEDGTWTPKQMHPIFARCYNVDKGNPGEKLSKYAYLVLMLAGIHINQQARSKGAAWKLAKDTMRAESRRAYAIERREEELAGARQARHEAIDQELAR